jgi:hypothetical protein
MLRSEPVEPQSAAGRARKASETAVHGRMVRGDGTPMTDSNGTDREVRQVPRRLPESIDSLETGRPCWSTWGVHFAIRTFSQVPGDTRLGFRLGLRNARFVATVPDSSHLTQHNGEIPMSEMKLKVSEKGGVSLYGLGRFPVTLYAEQWQKLLGEVENIKKFLEDNKALLKTKDAA